MTQPTGNFTIAEAADAWIAMIESPETKATPEQKAALVAQIRSAAPHVIGMVVGVGNVVVGESTQFCFTDACNNIKRVLRGAK